ncbi:hypothetical protein DNTS_022290 [Danionella cerebrum]|uniref:G-patch domain-containing protein n=1 Tax=Danionella cerebrum TaxID=2873325 RepID=A0A553NIB3_9TELE|nr:hypothetical protein DNTS_022290 [Danionella translucida]
MASNEDNDEDFVTYGIPLEPLEEDEPVRKPVPVHEQTVKDEKGRYMRFHGAFTGGFSAGYFNTVGSKEGWTPTAFVSSRQQKAERQNARPEDFMDEEDFGEHGIAPKDIVTTDKFASERRDQIKDKARVVSSLAAIIPGDSGLLEELIAPAHSSIGVELLRKMGWKDGQGVGPRLKRKPRKQNADAGRVYGCALPPNASEESEEEEDEFAPENVTFAPKDVVPVDFTPKEDLHGLGYRGLNPLQALSGGSGPGHINLFTLDSDRATDLFGGRASGQQQSRGGIAGQAFGVGAMEDEDSDIYHKDSMSNYDTVYPPPDLPRNYRPVHFFRPVIDPTSVSPIVAQALQASRGQLSQDEPQQGRHKLDSTQRRDMLGETPLQDRERLSEIRRAAEDRKKPAVNLSSAEDRAAVVASAKVAALQALSNRFQTTAPAASSEAQMALKAWSGPTADASKIFKPFSKNPQKQARYDLYISKLKQGDKDALDSSLDTAMTEWERGRERDEFVRAALLYKPSNSSLSSRFTRGKHEEDTDSVEVARDQENDVDDKQSAVKMKMFGKLTRDTFEWHPDKLLCKRFNVPDPYPGSQVSQDATSSSKALPQSTSEASHKKSRWDVSEQASEEKGSLSVLQQNEAAFTTHADSAPTAPEGTVAQFDGKQKTGKKEKEDDEDDDEDDEDEEEEEVRPPMDLFKAIFASSSEEKSSSSSEDEEEEVVPPVPEATQNPAGCMMPVKPLISAHISRFPDVSKVMDVKHPPMQSIPSTENTMPSTHNAPAPSTGLGEEEFGPRLPPPGFVTSSYSPQLKKQKKREKDKHKKHKKEKKKKKSKKHKHKGKQKKRDEQSSSSSSEETDSNAEDESEDISARELLQRVKNLRNIK